MMNKHRIGLITDIHGNDKALTSVLEILKDKVDEIICLGDLIGIGPNSNEVLDIVRQQKNFHCVLGNHDRYFLYGFNNPGSCTEQAHQDWVKASISKENGAFLATIPLMIERTYNNKKILFIHYGYRDLTAMRFMPIIHSPNESDIEATFKLTPDYDMYFFGHEHVRSVVKGNKEYVCVGSLGCPVPTSDEGRYAILEIGDDIKYELYTFKYDPSSVVQAIIDKKMPQGEFIRKNFYMQK